MIRNVFVYRIVIIIYALNVIAIYRIIIKPFKCIDYNMEKTFIGTIHNLMAIYCKTQEF